MTAQQPVLSADKSSLARDVWVRFKEVYETYDHEKFVQEAILNDNYYRGDQWRDEDRKKLESVGRPALTINKILPTLNTIFGEQINKRMMVAYTPLRDATTESAVAMSKYAMHVLRKNQYAWRESEVFQDGHITGRGWFDVRIAFDENPMGEIVIDTEHFAEVIPDPLARDYDPAKWNEGWVMRWRTIDQIEADYGIEKRREVEVAGFMSLLPSECVRWGKLGTFGYHSDPYFQAILQDRLTQQQRGIQEVLVVERQSARMVRRHYLVSPTNGTRKPLPVGTSDQEAQALALQFGAYLQTLPERKIWWEAVVGDRVVLHDAMSPYRSFSFIPYFPYFRRGKSFGSVKNLRSPQDQLNKLASQELHIVNTTANSGWIIEQGSVVNLTPDELQAQGATTGLVIVTAPGRRAPEKIKPNTVPTGIDRVSMKAEAHIKEISNVSDAMLGTESAEVSGVALERKETRGQISMVPALDNLTRTRYLIARKIKELMQDHITEHRIILATSELDPTQVEQLELNNPERPETVLANGEYDIEITTMPANDTYRDQQFAQMLNLRSVGAPIPWYRVVQASNLADRLQVAQEVQSMEGLAPPTEEEQQIASMVQQMNLQLQQLQLAELEGQIQLLESQVQLNMAKAQQAGVNPTMEMNKLESQLAIKREEFNLRKQLAALSSINKLDAIQAQGREIMKQMILTPLTEKKGENTNAK